MPWNAMTPHMSGTSLSAQHRCVIHLRAEFEWDWYLVGRWNADPPLRPHPHGHPHPSRVRYCAGVRETLECFFDSNPIRDEYLVVQNGGLAGVGAHSYSPGSATGGSEKAVEGKNV